MGEVISHGSVTGGVTKQVSNLNVVFWQKLTSLSFQTSAENERTDKSVLNFMFFFVQNFHCEVVQNVRNVHVNVA